MFHAQWFTIKVMAAPAVQALDQRAEKEVEAFIKGSCEKNHQQERSSFCVRASVEDMKCIVFSIILPMLALRQGGPRLRLTQVYPAKFGKFIAKNHMDTMVLSSVAFWFEYFC